MKRIQLGFPFSFAGRAASLLGLLTLSAAAQAAGILTPVNSSDLPVQLESHHVRVVINNGFARTEVEQTFLNPNAFPIEAIYQAPVPEKGALSELTIWAGETVLQGEVVSKDEADRIYQEEKEQGNEVAKASQDAYQRFEFMVASVPAKGSARMRYVYYEPLPIDTGVGRYTYRLEEGGTDEAAASFWTLQDSVNKDVSIEVLLKSAWPVSKTRTPHFAGSVEAIDERTLRYTYADAGGRLDQDFVFYYMLEEGLPGRLEMVTYRETDDKPGAFMMVMTPGVDLAPLEGGSDYVFALDVSGSMSGKLQTLVSGVKKALQQLNANDRFRIVAFNNRAWDLTRDWISASPENVAASLVELESLGANGGTNVYDGVRRSLGSLDSDRVSTLILVTDGVTNEGIVDPAAFYKLLHGQDVRFYGYLLGNSSNWPLMRLMCEASGGAYRAVSNSDDIIGEILLAKNKIAYQSMHHAELSIDGTRVFDVTDFKIGKIHYGDQLTLFGRYEAGGEARVRLKTRISGEERIYETHITFPDTDTSHPEIERLWAMDQVQKIELNEMAGLLRTGEAKEAVRSLGVAYQIVTNETSMIAMADESFDRHGIQRRNLERVSREGAARQVNPNARGAQRVDSPAQPMYQQRSHSMGGGGSVGPWFAILLASGATLLLFSRRKPAGSAGRLGGLALTLLALGAYQHADATDSAEHAMRRSSLPSSSIDRSIEEFWSVSEAEARVDEPAPRAALVTESQTDGRRSESSSRECSEKNDTMSLDQRRHTRSDRGRFGLTLFDRLPIIGFVWGNDSENVDDRFSGRK
ncbi:VIT and VWA domain-containing protein [Pelagicoccus sp. SDUM812003]|uniref:VIT and vWA domain-containing protein n=1 Tax=Pelagicoccus sp. SDUM812003 TaxID=3041267 RepID=UPI00280DA155|nr:VIT and VWA domain-containing protein [Pelagicoccus sp. SDUM812003]MDQ8202427.1 VIT and VWA domain-containing protein [Pelagicoccus sp. SDUM812003]